MAENEEINARDMLEVMMETMNQHTAMLQKQQQEATKALIESLMSNQSRTASVPVAASTSVPVPVVVKRVLPALPPLVDEASLDAWDHALTHMGVKYDLEDYIEKSHPQPEKDTDEYRTWKENCLDLVGVRISSLTSGEVWQRVIDLGWGPKDLDPYVLKQKIFQSLQHGGKESRILLMQEYTHLRRDKFVTFADFWRRLRVLKQRLDPTGAGLQEEAHILIALGSIRGIYNDVYDRLVRLMDDDKLTWETLILEFNQKKVLEEGLPTAMAKVEVTTAKEKQTTTQSNGNSNSQDWYCKECKKTVTTTKAPLSHCKTCDRHYPKDKICWWCNPEKAPSPWNYKKKALAKKRRLLLRLPRRPVPSTTIQGP